jgi:hypothetical protein
MTFLNDCNQIANQLSEQKFQKKIEKHRHVVGPMVKLNINPGVYALTTSQAAKALNRSEQTLRIWSCKKNGPICPININGRLAWRVSDIEALLNGDLTLQPPRAEHDPR